MLEVSLLVKRVVSAVNYNIGFFFLSFLSLSPEKATPKLITHVISLDD